MKLKENETIPNAEVFILENGEPVKKNIENFLKNKKSVIFGLPGAYTSVCSAKHLPGYVKNIENSFMQMKYILSNSERKNAKGKKGNIKILC